ncbi:hypothetical protein [Haematomicrobium sanguinis]|uniref:hypothetical protein n=1 Tax=Haematomicrobium sanguinis TaxID=479106 RepID=UPI000478F219|nr:hypothetical protein [Haematomicrobium sanguinis]
MSTENNEGYQPGEYVGDSGDYANDERFNEEQILIEQQSRSNFRESFEDENTLDRELAAEEPDFGRELEEEADDAFDDRYSGPEDADKHGMADETVRLDEADEIDDEGDVDAESEVNLDELEEPEDSYDRLIENSRNPEPEDTGNAWHDSTRGYGEGNIRDVNVDEDRFERDDVWGNTGDDR